MERERSRREAYEDIDDLSAKSDPLLLRQGMHISKKQLLALKMIRQIQISSPGARTQFEESMASRSNVL